MELRDLLMAAFLEHEHNAMPKVNSSALIRWNEWNGTCRNKMLNTPPLTGMR